MRSDLVDAISTVGARLRVAPSRSPPTSRRYLDALVVLVSVALILFAILISL
jgi:hypothetical protein